MLSFRSDLKANIAQSSLIGVGWATLCAVLLCAFSLKLLNFGGFFSYLGSVTLLSSRYTVPLGLLILLIEFAAPLLSLSPRQPPSSAINRNFVELKRFGYLAFL
jgi:hypothetical protein